MIHFKCSQCSTTIHASDEHAGKQMRCVSCRLINTIPKRSTITSYGSDIRKTPVSQATTRAYKSDNSTADRFFSWVGDSLVENPLQKLLLSVPLILCVIAWAVTGQWEIPLMTTAAWTFAYIAARSRFPILNGLHSLFYYTTVGLSLVLMMFILLYLNMPDGQIDPPTWFVHLDEYFIEFKTNFGFLEKASLFVWGALFLLLLIGNLHIVKMRLATRFSKVTEVLGKTSTIIFVFTSFTFFAPQVVDAAIDTVLKKKFSYAFRKEDDQKRSGLLYETIKERIKAESKPVENFTEKIKYDTELMSEFTGLDVSDSVNTHAGMMLAAVKNETLTLLASYRTQFEDTGSEELEGVLPKDLLDEEIDLSAKRAEGKADKIWEERKAKSKSWATERREMVNQMEDSLSEEIIRNKERRAAAEALLSEALGSVVPGEIGYLKNVLIEVFNTVAKTSVAIDDAVRMVQDVVSSGSKVTSGLLAAINKTFKFRRGEIPLPEPPPVINQNETALSNIPHLDDPYGTRAGKSRVGTARCLACMKQVSASSRVGQKCPHCGVTWTAEVRNDE